MNASRVAATLLFLALPFTLAARGATTTTVVDIPAADGGTQRYLHVRPDAPVATIVLIAGGPGFFGFGNDGTSSTRVGECDAVHRNRAAYAARGIAVASIDQTTTGSVRRYENILAVVRHVRERDRAPVWIVGSSAGTEATALAAATLPADIPAGVVFYSPVGLPDSVSAIRRPAQVVWHSGDPLAFGDLVYNTLTSAPARERSVFTGGAFGPCFGPHSMDGLDAEFVDGTAGFITRYNSTLGAAAPLNLQGLWYRGDVESGWGLGISHQGDTLFATWFTYDTDGSQMWLVGPDVRKTAGNTYSGTLFRTTGPAFSSVPFTPIGGANVTQVGTVILSFTDSNDGTFGYTVNGVTQSKPITRQVFGPLPTCTAGGAPGSPIHAQDLWYAAPAGSEAGWGVSVTQQGDVLFIAWFTYDANGRGMWVVGPRFERTTGDSFAGALYRTTGPAFNANPWNPQNVVATQVGTGTLTFTAHDAGTFGYTVNGITQAKNITRQVFGSPVTVCR